MMDEVADLSAADRWATARRPLAFFRLRLNLDAAHYLRTILVTELARADREEDDNARLHSRWLVGIISDIDDGLGHPLTSGTGVAYVKARVWSEVADWLRDLLEAEQDDAYDQLAALRDDGVTEDDERIQTARDHLGLLLQMLRDLGRGKIETVGFREGQ
jgi:hypothetical protein